MKTVKRLRPWCEGRLSVCDAFCSRGTLLGRTKKHCELGAGGQPTTRCVHGCPRRFLFQQVVQLAFQVVRWRT